MQELWAVSGGSEVATDQLLYNLARRGIEWDLLPWLRERHVPVMAYSPIEQAELAFHRKLANFARKYGMPLRRRQPLPGFWPMMTSSLFLKPVAASD